MNLKTIDLCAGIGGIRRGFELAGDYRNIASAEIDEMACKTYRYKKQARDAKAAEHLLNKRSTILIDDEYEEDSIGIDEDDLKEVDNIDTEITDYISSAPIKAIRNSFSSGDGKSMAEIVAVAKFDSDEIAFFTKNYKAYSDLVTAQRLHRYRQGKYFQNPGRNTAGQAI